MSAGPSVVERAAGFAPAAQLLAAWWSPPTADETARWETCWDGAGEVADSLGPARSVVEDLRAALEAARPEALREEYERLLIGPGRAPCAPYESLWRTDQPRREQGRLMASCAADAVRVYRDLGLKVRADAHEMPDHIVVEWEALAYALEHDAADAAAALAREHLAGWMPAFCAAVGAETEQPFYAVLARLTPAWTAVLAA
jgi:TorA maturation chaperone TorD